MDEYKFLRGKLFHIYEGGNVSRSDENTIDYYHDKDACLIPKEKCVFRNLKY